MKTETLLEKITPLPFTVTEWAGNKTGISNERGHISKSFVFDKHMAGDAKATTAYLVHCANNFPKLLEALENLAKAYALDHADYDEHDVWTEADLTLTQAREVKG